MYAIVNIAGQQFKVAKDQYLFVHRLQGEEGASIEFDNVLLAENNGNAISFIDNYPKSKYTSPVLTFGFKLRGDVSFKTLLFLTLNV